MVSEIVTNSLKATGLADARPGRADPHRLALIQVRVLLFPAAVIIEVWDRDPAGPVLQHATPDRRRAGGGWPSSRRSAHDGTTSPQAGAAKWSGPNWRSRPGRQARRTCRTRTVYRDGRRQPRSSPPGILPAAPRIPGPASPLPGPQPTGHLRHPPRPRRLGGAHRPQPPAPPGKASALTDPRPAPRPLWGYHPTMDR